jgi:hypothetical protein
MIPSESPVSLYHNEAIDNGLASLGFEAQEDGTYLKDGAEDPKCKIKGVKQVRVLIESVVGGNRARVTIKAEPLESLGSEIGVHSIEDTDAIISAVDHWLSMNSIVPRATQE